MQLARRRAATSLACYAPTARVAAPSPGWNMAALTAPTSICGSSQASDEQQSKVPLERAFEPMNSVLATRGGVRQARGEREAVGITRAQEAIERAMNRLSSSLDRVMRPSESGAHTVASEPSGPRSGHCLHQGGGAARCLAARGAGCPRSHRSTIVHVPSPGHGTIPSVLSRFCNKP